MSNVTYVKGEELTALANGLKSKGENILNTYKGDCSQAIQLSSECLQVSGLSSANFLEALEKIYSQVNDRLASFADFLTNVVVQEYAAVSEAIVKNFNTDFANEISGLLGIPIAVGLHASGTGTTTPGGTGGSTVSGCGSTVTGCGSSTVSGCGGSSSSNNTSTVTGCGGSSTTTSTSTVSGCGGSSSTTSAPTVSGCGGSSSASSGTTTTNQPTVSGCGGSAAVSKPAVSGCGGYSARSSTNTTTTATSKPPITGCGGGNATANMYKYYGSN